MSLITLPTFFVFNNKAEEAMAEKGHNNLKNALIAFLVPLPSIFFYLYFLRQDPSSHSFWSWCSDHPLLLANALFFFNVNCLFWIIGQIQSSHWMIDPYWTVIPVMLVHYYATHPLLAVYNVGRSRVVILLTWLWSVRLTHSYFRREKWEWGAREDWRFSDMRRQYGNHWWWSSFFAVYVSQQIFLIGITTPFYAVHTVNMPWSIWDYVAILVSATGIVLAYFADTQLHEFVTMNNELKQSKKPTIPTLESGLWRYSRHPNYFGEQLWWWGVAIFGWSLGYGWALLGAFVNSMCLAYVTILVEERMLNQAHRAEAYKNYQKTTSVWIPWFKPSSSQATREKSN